MASKLFFIRSAGFFINAFIDFVEELGLRGVMLLMRGPIEVF
jgi:hypothetical protein